MSVFVNGRTELMSPSVTSPLEREALTPPPFVIVKSAFPACVIAAVMLLTGRMILSGFVSGTPVEIKATVDVAYRYLAIMCVCLPVLYLLYIFRSSTQGLGNTFLPMVSAFAELVMRIASALILARVIGETGLFIAEVAAWGGAVIVLVFSYFYTIRKIERKAEPVC